MNDEFEPKNPDEENKDKDKINKENENDRYVEEFDYTEPTEEDLTEEEIVRAENIEAKITKATKAAAAGITWQRELYEWTQSIAVALVIAFIINQFFFSIVKVDGTSMEDTLHNYDRLVVSRFMYTPKFRDIVILKPTDTEKRYLVKRVIGMPGQTIDIHNGTVYIDGEPLIEPYTKEATINLGNTTFPLTIGENQIFVMGDNRNRSLDSRFSSVGVIPFDHVYGKAIYRFWPFDKFGSLYYNLP